MYNDGTYFSAQLLGTIYELWYMVQQSYIESFLILGTVSLIMGLVHLLLKDKPGILFVVKVFEFLAALILLVIAFSYVNSLINSLHY